MRLCASLLFLQALLPVAWDIQPVYAQSHVTSPKEYFGFSIGDDYHLATYTQTEGYWKKLAGESDRMKLVEIGKTAEGRAQWMAIISSPANLARLDHYRDIARRLARADEVTEAQARGLAHEGRAVVWIDGGLHATEVLGSHQLIEHVWQMLSRNDPETQRLLKDVIQLCVFANPDGMELVSGWYMRKADPAQRGLYDIPRPYQKYIGHDNNRDFYLNAMPESENMSRVLYREWYPQIMYNHHQTGPAGTVMFAPPFRDPHNFQFDPVLINSLTLVGAAMHTRFAVEGKPGVVMRNGASYQTWWNGGLRTTAYFHNIVGILTETIGSPTPMEIPLVPQRQLSTGDLPYPIAPQPWHFRQSIDYSITANRAILDLASKYREDFLYNIYLMGHNAIARGNRDSWTIAPKRIERLRAKAGSGQPEDEEDPAFAGRIVATKFNDLLKEPLDRDPRGYVITRDQPDFMTATRFVNALLKSGVDVLRATAAFSANGKQYPAGSYVVKAAQAFRAHVLDMFEPQDYPNDIPYPGGPPKPPYDNAGYTLALQMGVNFDRVLEGFDGAFARVNGPMDAVARSDVKIPDGSAYVIRPSANDAFVAVNRALAAQVKIDRLADGAFRFPSDGRSREILLTLAKDRALPIEPAPGPTSEARAVRSPRIGLVDVYGGSIPAGWIRFILEQFEFPFRVVYPADLEATDLRSKYDVLIFATGVIPSKDGEASSPFAREPKPEDVPAEYRSHLGRISVGQTVPALKRFLEAGGGIVTIGSSTVLAKHLQLPIENHLVERSPSGTVKPLPREKFYIPASLLEVAVDSAAPTSAGMSSNAIVMFDQSPVFRLNPDGRRQGIRPLAWFPTASPLRSGWAWGQTYLEGGVVAAEAKVGRGTLYLFGPEITYRSQPHGTFKWLFNALFAGE